MTDAVGLSRPPLTHNPNHNTNPQPGSGSGSTGDDYLNKTLAAQEESMRDLLEAKKLSWKKAAMQALQ